MDAIPEPEIRYWRQIVTLGKNTASYKFALAQAILELGRSECELVSLEELAVPYATRIAEHLENHRQGVMTQSRFLSACEHFNRATITVEDLRDATVELGFRNVIDAFHVVPDRPSDIAFFVDERSAPGVPAIRLTDSALGLASAEETNVTLESETEARWNLVENAWDARHEYGMDLVVAYDAPREIIVEGITGSRRRITEGRWAFNGYQRGRCFYCAGDVSIVPGHPDLAHIDHYFPHSLMARGLPFQLDSPWNLVLACASCNLSKSARIPAERFLALLSARNETLIMSHHPLRESIMAISGATYSDRARFLRSVDQLTMDSFSSRAFRWEPPEPQGPESPIS